MKDPEIILRAYRPDDLSQIEQLFYDTVHTVNARDYSPEQLQAWAAGRIDREEWNRSLLEHRSIVAVKGREIVGFGDMDSNGYLDRLYIHKTYQGQGIATAICDRLESAVAEGRILLHASLTARPFFEKRGYRVRKEQQVERRGVLLTNFQMEKKIERPPRFEPKSSESIR